MITYIIRKKTSYNTEISYRRDLGKMAEFFARQGITDPSRIGEFDLVAYMDYMEKENFASSTISRSVASMRAFFQYLFSERKIEKNPADNLKSPKVEKSMPEILSIQEVDDLLKQPDLNHPKEFGTRLCWSSYMLPGCGSVSCFI